MKGTYLIICGTVTLEFSSKAFIMSPLHRILSTHWKQRGPPGSELIHLHTGSQTHLGLSQPADRVLRLQGHCLGKGKANTASIIQILEVK